MMELEIIVFNNGYRGVARGYDTSENLQILAKQLDEFPNDEQSISYKIPESRRNITMVFSPIKLTGLIGVKVDLETEGFDNCDRSKVSLELLVEPNSIDLFQKYLTTLSIKQEGVVKQFAR